MVENVKMTDIQCLIEEKCRNDGMAESMASLERKSFIVPFCTAELCFMLSVYVLRKKPTHYWLLATFSHPSIGDRSGEFMPYGARTNTRSLSNALHRSAIGAARVQDGFNKPSVMTHLRTVYMNVRDVICKQDAK